MTAPELRERVRFYLNQLASPRIDDIFHINQGLNAAQVKFIEDRTDNIKQSTFRSRKVFFEAVERVRSELYTIVIESPVTVVGNVIAMPTTPLPEFYYELALQLTYSTGEIQWSTPKSWNEYQELHRNSFSKPNNTYPVHTRTSVGMTVDFGAVNTIASAILVYLTLPPAIDVTANITSILPPVTHEELCEIAAHVISGTYDDFRKSQSMKVQIEED